MGRDFLSRSGEAGAAGEPLTPAQARFQDWLHSRGYLPAHEHCAYEGTEGGDRVTDNAADLLWDYLENHPEDEPNRPELQAHAAAIGEVSHCWGGDGDTDRLPPG